MPHPAFFNPPFVGRFYRAIDPQFREHALAGSRTAGRYSRPNEPTLYLSSSIAGVEAAMRAHRSARTPALELVDLDVEANKIVDLRDSRALSMLDINLADALAPWQEIVASGGAPSSWTVRDRLVSAGAHGLIDPSRTRPGLWHLVLFRWNEPGAPRVEVVDAQTAPIPP